MGPENKLQDSNKRSIEVEYDSDDSQRSAIAQLLEDVDYIINKSNKGIEIRDVSQIKVNKRDAAGSVDRECTGLNEDQYNNLKNHGKNVLPRCHITLNQNTSIHTSKARGHIQTQELKNKKESTLFHF